MQAGNNVSIGGFIVNGQMPKKMMLRGIGPSMSGLSPLLADPVIELHGPDGSLIASNDNWKDTQEAAIRESSLAPTDDLESALIAVLGPAGYTAILRGKNGASGIGLIEIYDLEEASDSKLANLSTRGFVQTADDVMIVGLIAGHDDSTAPENLLIRAIGPSISGITNVLVDPTLSLYDANGSLLLSDDNWQVDPAQAAKIIATGIPPRNDLESAIVITLPPGAYTAVVAGKDGGTGVALAEIYHLP